MANSTEFKRHFPRMKKCCLCLSLKKGVLFFTYVFFVCGVIGFLGFDMSKKVSGQIIQKSVSISYYIFYIMYIVTLALLIIGIHKVKVSLMRQFKYVFVIYLIYIIIYNFIVYKAMYYSDEYRNMLVERYKKNNIKYNNGNGSVEELVDSTIKIQKISSLIGYIIGILLYIYYYIATCSYIEDVEENVLEENNTKNLESNEY